MNITTSTLLWIPKILNSTRGKIYIHSSAYVHFFFKLKSILNLLIFKEKHEVKYLINIIV